MAVDLNLEVFAYDLFNAIWIRNKIIDSAPPASEVFKEYSGESNFNQDILKAVICRQLVFHDSFKLIFDQGNVTTFKGKSDFFKYICNSFRMKPSGSKMFECIFATCAYVAELGLYCCSKGNFSFMQYAYLCWAMYVDTEIKSVFYEEGGWKVLKYAAKIYTSSHIILNINTIRGEKPYCGRIPFHKFLMGMEDVIFFDTISIEQREETRAKTWVNFRAKNKYIQPNVLDEPEIDTKSYEDSEHFLLRLRKMCDPLNSQVKDLKNYWCKEKCHLAETSSGTKDLNNNTANSSECEQISSEINNIGILDPEINASKEKQVSNLKNFLRKENISKTSEGKDLENNTIKPYDTLKDVNLTNAEEPVTCEFPDLTQYMTTNKITDNQEVIENLQIQDGKCSADHRVQKQKFKNFNIEAIPKTKHTSKGVKNSNNHSPKSKAPTPRKGRNFQGIQTQHLTNSNIAANQVRNTESQQGHLNTGISKTHLDKGHLKSALESSKIQDGRRISDHADGEQKVKHVSTGAIPKTKRTSKNVKISNNRSPNSKAPTTGHEMPNAVKDKRKETKLHEVEPEATLSIPIHVDPEVPNNADSYPDDTKDILRMIIVLGCQPGLNYVRSTLKFPKK